MGAHLAFAPALAEADDGYAARYFPRLVELEPGNFWYESRNRLIVWALARYFPGATSCLEIGCGTGFVLSAIHQAFPTLALAGGEISRKALAYARTRAPGAALFQMDARAIPFEDEFDVIGCFDVLEHVEDDGAVLSQMSAATRPGGGIVLTVPQHRFLWGPADDFAHHQRRYRRDELVGKLARAGFAVLGTTSFVSLLLPSVFLWRRLERRSRHYEHLSELTTGKILHPLLERVLDFERTLIERGLSLPVGASLLVVAAKKSATGDFRRELAATPPGAPRLAGWRQPDER